MMATQTGASSVNYRKISEKETRVRVMCPKCGAGGGHSLESRQPKCHVCVDDVLMLPANNESVVCSWEDAVAFFRGISYAKVS